MVHKQNFMVEGLKNFPETSTSLFEYINIVGEDLKKISVFLDRIGDFIREIGNLLT